MKDSDIKKAQKIPLVYKKTKHFLHCRHCVEEFNKSPLNGIMTQKDYSMYEFGTYDFVYPDKTQEKIIVVWCKRCKKKIWDSRGYKKIF